MVKRNISSIFNSLSFVSVYTSDALERFGMAMLRTIDKQNEIMRQNRRFWKYNKRRGR